MYVVYINDSWFGFYFYSLIPELLDSERNLNYLYIAAWHLFRVLCFIRLIDKKKRKKEICFCCNGRKVLFCGAKLIFCILLVHRVLFLTEGICALSSF